MTTSTRFRSVGPRIDDGFEGLRAITASHRTAGFGGLARVALLPTAQRALLERLHEARLEAVLLCTCNRTELYWHAQEPTDDETAWSAILSVWPSAAAGRPFETLAEIDAARHLFRVSAGLESLLVGEAEILGQLREAIDAAALAGTKHAFLQALFRAALRSGGRARMETRIGIGALSVASAAARHLARELGDLSTRTVVVIGAGATGAKVARHLTSEGIGTLVLLNRTRDRAEEVACASDAVAGSLDDLPRWLERADAVVVAARAETPLLGPERLRAARPGTETIARPLVLLDLSLPHAIHPACAGIAGVALHDLSGLERVVADNRAMRESEIPRVEALLERELGFFTQRARSRAARVRVVEPARGDGRPRRAAWGDA